MANIYSFLSWQFWFFAVLTGIALFVTFYAAGSSMIRRFFHVRSAIVHVLLAAVLGMVMWGIQGWVFGFLHVRWLSYIYVLRCILLLIVNWQSEKKIFTQLWQEIRASDRFVAAFILFGSFLQLFSVFGSGLRYTKGVEFFRANSVDGILHLSYIQEIAQHFPPNEPGEFGLKINHYHFWSDLVLADLARVWQLPISHLFFQFIPIFISIFTGVAVYVVARSWKGSRTVGLWALFFLYFGSDAAYLFMLFFHHQFGFQTAAIDNGMTQFLNTPHTFAKLVFCTALFPFQKWLETHKKSWGVLTTVLFGCLVGFKVYFGIFAGLGLVFLTFAKIGKHVWTARKSFHWKTVFGKIWHEEKFFFLMVGVFVVMSALIYFPVNKGAGGLFYSPLEWPKIFLGKDNIDWEVWWQRKMIYEAANNIPEIVLFDLIAIFICLVSVYGTRLVGLFPPRKLIRSLGWEHIAFLWPPSILFIFLGLYTLQNSGLFNVFNFFAVSTVVFALFAAFVMGELQERREKWTKILLVLVIVLTLPRPIHEVFDLLSLYATNHYDYVVDNAELEAFQFIKKSLPKDAVIQAHPYNNESRQTPYVAFFTNHQTFLTGISSLDSHNQPFAEKRQKLEKAFSYKEPDTFYAAMKELNIQYLYLRKNDDDEKLHFSTNQPFLKTLYENNETIVLKISQ